jgi:3-oxoacyl-[acyl-carrier protein] reductase
MDIRNKTALVTGASRGIGREIALELARQGARRIILVARNRQRLTEVAIEIEAIGAEVIVLPLDLTQTAEVTIAVANVWQNSGPIHCLVNCAGVAHQAPFLESRLVDVQAEISTNLVGMYTITRLIAKRMAAKREGTIVNVSSLMGKVAAPTMATYSATKFAIVGFTQALRRELACHRIQVVAVLPSLTETDMVQGLTRFRWMLPLTPQYVAKVLVAGLSQSGPEIVVGWQSHLAMLCQRLMPQLLEKAVQLAMPIDRAARSAPLANRS